MFYKVTKINSVTVANDDNIIATMNKNFTYNLNKTESDYQTRFKNLFNNLSNDTVNKVLITATIEAGKNSTVTISPTSFEVPSTGNTSLTLNSSENLSVAVFSNYEVPIDGTIRIINTSVSTSNKKVVEFKVITNNFTGNRTNQLVAVTEKDKWIRIDCTFTSKS